MFTFARTGSHAKARKKRFCYNGTRKFSSRLGFILISAGCAIGLGNVYRFPIWCGAYGGGLFLLFYLIFLLLLGLPVMTVELAVGRGSRRSIANSFDVLEKKGQKWHLMKYLGVTGNYLLMMFYTSISGWFLRYFWKYLTGSIIEMNTAEQLGNVFVSMVSNPGLNIVLTFLVVLLCFGVRSDVWDGFSDGMFATDRDGITLVVQNLRAWTVDILG